MSIEESPLITPEQEAAIKALQEPDELEEQTLEEVDALLEQQQASDGSEDAAGAAQEEAANDEASTEQDGVVQDETADTMSPDQGKAGEPAETVPDVGILKQRVDEITEQLKELARQFDNGDINEEEREEQRLRLMDERDDLKQAIRYSQQQEAIAQQEWRRNCTDFVFKTHADFYLDQEGELDPVKQAAFDAAVRKVAANARGMNAQQILAKAHANLLQAFGVKAGQQEEGAKKTSKAKPALPPNIGSVPAAESTDLDNDSRFGALNRLKGRAAEAAIAAMSKAERDAYYRS